MKPNILFPKHIAPFIPLRKSRMNIKPVRHPKHHQKDPAHGPQITQNRRGRVAPFQTIPKIQGRVAKRAAHTHTRYFPGVRALFMTVSDLDLRIEGHLRHKLESSVS